MDDTPVIKVGGKEFKIPLLAARQNRVIDPLLIKIMPKLSGGVNALAALSENYDDLQKIVYTAITRANPEISWELFSDLPITLPEMIAASVIIAQQTGLFKRGEPGEAKGVNPPTGTI